MIYHQPTIAPDARCASVHFQASVHVWADVWATMYPQDMDSLARVQATRDLAPEMVEVALQLLANLRTQG